MHRLRMPLPFALDHINLWLLEDTHHGQPAWTIVDTGYGRTTCAPSGTRSSPGWTPPWPASSSPTSTPITRPGAVAGGEIRDAPVWMTAGEFDGACRLPRDGWSRHAADAAPVHPPRADAERLAHLSAAPTVTPAACRPCRTPLHAHVRWRSHHHRWQIVADSCRIRPFARSTHRFYCADAGVLISGDYAVAENF